MKLSKFVLSKGTCVRRDWMMALTELSGLHLLCEYDIYKFCYQLVSTTVL